MASAITGGCACGAVRYAISDSGFLPYACHCKGCQSRQGSAFALNMWVMAEGITVEGEMICGTVAGNDGATVTHYACPHCLTRLYTLNDHRPQLANLRAGTRDDSDGLVPAFHIWISSKQPWIVLPDDVPALAEQPSDPVQWLRLVRGESA